MIWSFAVTFSAGDKMVTPLTLTRPSAIHCSASRREQRPARAMTLAIRSTESAAGAAGVVSSNIRRGAAGLRGLRSVEPGEKGLRGPVINGFDLAFEAAKAAALRGEVPVGAVILRDGEVIASAGNRTLQDKDPTAHAEILALRAAARVLDSERLIDCDLYVTLEPCAMCAGAISFARIRRLYYCAPDVKGGAVAHGPRFFSQPTCHHAPDRVG
eukprot:gene9593-9671_t